MYTCVWVLMCVWKVGSFISDEKRESKLMSIGKFFVFFFIIHVMSV